MPVALIECCGQTFTPDECLEHIAGGRNKCEWTYELAAAMLHSMVQHPSHADGSRISTTVLTQKCLRQLVWERQTDYTTTLAKQWAMFRGTQFHGQLEAFAHPLSYAEARFYVHDLGVQIPEVKRALPRKDRSFSGSPDIVAPDYGRLGDYKRTKEVPRFNYAWADHAAQLNINRWLVDHADTVRILETTNTERFQGGVIDGVEYELEPSEYPPGLVSIEWTPRGPACTWDMTHPDVRERFVPREWQELLVIYVDDKGPKPIQITESILVPAKNGGTKRVRVPDIWTDEKVEALIAEKYIAARLALLAGIAAIPAGWEYQSHILCGYCPMRRLCAEHERNGE